MRERIDGFANDARKIGCYLEHGSFDSGVAHSHPAGDPDETNMVFVGGFIIGEQAFSDRVMDPEAHKMDHEFRKLADEEGAALTLAEQIAEQLRQGQDPLAIDEEEDD